MWGWLWGENCSIKQARKSVLSKRIYQCSLKFITFVARNSQRKELEHQVHLESEPSIQEIFHMTDVQVVWFPCGLAVWKKIRSKQTNLCFQVGLENSHLYVASAIFVSTEALLLCLFISLKKQIYYTATNLFSFLTITVQNTKPQIFNKMNLCVHSKLID